MAVGTRGRLVTGLGCLLRPWAVVAGAGCGVVGAHGCSCLWPVVGHCGHGHWWVVGSHCGWSCCDGGHCGWSRCDHRGRGRSLPFVFVGSRLSLLKVIIVGSCCCLLLLCIGGGQEQLLSCIVCVDGGGKKEGCHVTHCTSVTHFWVPVRYINSLI